MSAKGHRRDQRPSVSATPRRPPWADQLQTTAHRDRQGSRWVGCGPSPYCSWVAGLDWAPKPVRPGWGGRMAGEGGERSPIWATPGQRAGPTFLSSAQVQAGHPPPPWPSCGVCTTEACAPAAGTRFLASQSPTLAQLAGLLGVPLGVPSRDRWAGIERWAVSPGSTEPDTAPCRARGPGSQRLAMTS